MRCMSPGWRSLLAPVCAVLLLTGMGLVPTAAAVSPGSSLGSIALANGGPAPGDRFLGPVAPNTSVVVVLGLRYTDPGALLSLLSSVENPSSPDYRHYLTSQQFDQRFGPSPQEVRSVEGYLAGHGARAISASSGGAVVEAAMSSGAVQATFSTGLGWFEGASGRYYATTGTPVLPPELQGAVLGVSGLTDRDTTGLVYDTHSLGLGHADVARGKLASYDLVQGSSTQVFWGSDYQAIYDELPLLSSGVNGSGYAIATLLSSGWNQTANHGSGENLPPFDPAAINLYYLSSLPSGTREPAPVGVPLTIGGVTPPAPGTPPSSGGSTLGDDTGSVEENSLDIEMAQSMAPGARLYEFYFAGSLISQSLTSAAGDFDLDLANALSYNYTGTRLAAITNSWGLPDGNNTTWDGLLQKAAAMGVTVLAASGDQGDAPASLQNHPQGQWPPFPATAAFNTSGVLAVGGTTVKVTGTPTGTWNPNGNSLPPTGYDASNISGIASETAWWYPSTDTSNYGGTEGGISNFINEPEWQATSQAQSAIKYAAQKENTNYARGVPDIAASGNTTIIFFSQTQISGQTWVGYDILGGTSVASPLMAGMFAVLAQQAGKPLGFVSPAIYAIGGYFQTHTVPGDPFRDTVDGRNYLYNASVGWDALTGWGSPEAALLGKALANTTLTGYVYDSNGVPGKALGHLPSTTTVTPSDLWEFMLLAVLFVATGVALLAVVWVRRSSRHQAGASLAAPPPFQYSPGPAVIVYGAPPPPPPPPTVVVCSYCHRQVSTGLGFCPYCGSWLAR